jgi:endonuclease/exonuclease/phosphatase (EEP) superfamily protein YafD
MAAEQGVLPQPDVAAPRSRASLVVRRILAVLAALVCLGVAVPTVAVALRREPGILAILTALMPYVAVVSVVGLLLALLSRDRVVIAVAAVLAVVNVAWQLPLFVADPGGTGTPVLRVMSSNLKYGEGDAQTVVDLVRSQRIDVLALEELTPDAVQRLDDAGLDALLPYSKAQPETTFAGVGLWSRTPLSDVRAIDGLPAHAVAGVVTDSAGTRVTVVAVHPLAPGVDDHGGRDQDYGNLRAALAAIPGSVVVAGDFNATRDQAPFRGLESDGFLDAADQAGAGFKPTFPNNRRGRAVVAIDHVIARDLPARAVAWQTHDIARSDHLAVVAVYA